MTRAPQAHLALTALVLPLAGCGSGADQPAANTAAVPDNYAEQVRALPPGQRDGVLLRAIRDAGRDCQQVTKSDVVADTDVPTWAATCSGGGVWVIALNPGGIATVTNAADATGAKR